MKLFTSMFTVHKMAKVDHDLGLMMAKVRSSLRWPYVGESVSGPRTPYLPPGYYWVSVSNACSSTTSGKLRS